MVVPATLFAATDAAASGGILGALGIDWKLLAFQAVAFLILVWALGKFVFPVFLKIVDKRQEAIEESNRAAVEASKQAEKSKVETEKLLKKARSEAAEIVATAKSEAESIVSGAEARSTEQSERMIESAQQEIERQVLAAKKMLHNETIDLVAQATRKVVGDSVSANIDKKIIVDAVGKAK